MAVGAGLGAVKPVTDTSLGSVGFSIKRQDSVIFGVALGLIKSIRIISRLWEPETVVDLIQRSAKRYEKCKIHWLTGFVPSQLHH
jgi:hypothetical protein